MSGDPTEEEQSFADLLNGFTLDNGRRGAKGPPRHRDDHRRRDDHRPDPGAHPDHYAGEAPSIVRAYTWTGGRTRPERHLELETLVSATDGHPRATQAEHHAVVELCGRPRSVAEVAAMLSLPLGVAKVLLGDMADRGLILVHHSGPAPDLGLMERVLSGLRRL